MTAALSVWHTALIHLGCQIVAESGAVLPGIIPQRVQPIEPELASTSGGNVKDEPTQRTILVFVPVHVPPSFRVQARRKDDHF